MIYLTDEIALTADSMQYTVGKPVERPGKGVEMRDAKYYLKLGAALQSVVADLGPRRCGGWQHYRAAPGRGRTGRLEQEFSEKLKGVYV